MTSKHGTALLTKAPVAYDYGTTHEVDPDGPSEFRLVVVHDRHGNARRDDFLTDYQVGRYQSGLYVTIGSGDDPEYRPDAPAWELRRLSLVQSMLDSESITIEQTDLRLNEDLLQDLVLVMEITGQSMKGSVTR